MRGTVCCCWIAACLVLVVSSCPAAEERTVVVRPSELNGWVVATQKGTMSETDEGFAIGEFVVGESPSPLGKGSFHMKVNSHCYRNPLSKVYLGSNALNGIDPKKLTQLKLSVCPMHGDHRAAQPVTVELALGNPKGKLRLFTFLPWGFAPTGYLGNGKWREVDLMRPRGAWELTNVALADNQGDWSWLARRYQGFSIAVPPAKDWPAGTISGTGFSIKIGGLSASDREHEDPPSWHQSSGCECYVDKLIIGYADDTGKEIVTTYDFEPDADPVTPAQLVQR